MSSASTTLSVARSAPAATARSAANFSAAAMSRSARHVAEYLIKFARDLGDGGANRVGAVAVRHAYDSADAFEALRRFRLHTVNALLDQAADVVETAESEPARSRV
jgi:hypothetical protein